MFLPVFIVVGLDIDFPVSLSKVKGLQCLCAHNGRTVDFQRLTHESSVFQEMIFGQACCNQIWTWKPSALIFPGLSTELHCCQRSGSMPDTRIGRVGIALALPSL
ncbi:hypothetical protein RRG08_041982 [Elysia crispata]|uniref:Uncharacterized protein n=1 Tax=Elysia crispata TaxID=231223 RepID=A0AAE1D7G8_9GAST|nr:hypothetical protein RRG08_041982 [Elysia crispata]